MNLSGTCFLRTPEYDLSKKKFLKILNIFLWTSKKKGGVNVGQQISHSFENEKKIKINVNSSKMCLVYMVNYLYIHFLVYGFIVFSKIAIVQNYPTLSRITPVQDYPTPLMQQIGNGSSFLVYISGLN